MFYKTTTKTSVIFSSDEDIHKRAILITARILGGAYEVNCIELKVTATAEFYFEPNLPQAERKCLVDEIFGMYEEVLASLQPDKV